MKSLFKFAGIIFCLLGLCFGCGNASPSEWKNRSDTVEYQTVNSDSGSLSNDSVVAEDSSFVDPNCIHPEVVKNCKDDWCTIPSGCFIAGSPETEMGHGIYAEIQNKITLTNSFEIQQFEVTQKQWESVGFYNSSVQGPNGDGLCADPECPLDSINWYEAVAFANRMSELHVPPLPPCYEMKDCTGEIGRGMVCAEVNVNAPTIYECKGYRLPTVYEWEYAIRAGTLTAFYSGDITNYDSIIDCEWDANLDKIAWYCKNSDNKTHPKGKKEPNGWGLYDMAGNVFEWVDTSFNGRATGPDPVTDPTGPTDYPDDRILRGGAYYAPAINSRSAAIFSLPRHLGKGGSFGTRLVRTLH